MTILDQADLEFAKRHLERYADSDFFPPMDAYDAIWADWANFSGRLTSENIAKLPLASALALPVSKGRTSYRIVHQLDPITSITYTALAHAVAAPLEAARADEHTACSFRFAPDDGAFFSKGQGYDRYRARSEQLAGEYAWGASVDIADFYNQIYSHRVRASVEASRAGLGEIAHDVERVIHAINTGASKGIPVGGDASAVLAEGILIDVDQLIERAGVLHTRYVDDIRMFSNDPQRLQSIIENLSEYLYDHHRLHLNSSKTRLLPMEKFIEDVIQDHSDTEIEAAMHLLGQMDPYGEEGLDENDIPDEAVLEQIGNVILERTRENGYTDLNLIKAYIRRARLASSATFVPIVIQRTEAFIPAVHDLARTMSALIDANKLSSIMPLVDHIRASNFYRRKAVRYWMDWLCSGCAELLRNHSIREAVFEGDLRFQARAAITMRDLAWVRAQRSSFVHLPPMHRSAVMLSMQLIGSDERRHLLAQVGNDASPVDLAVKRLVLSK